MLTDKTIVVTGGTGSLGKVLVRRLLSGELGQPKKIIVFSRDEAKQHDKLLIGLEVFKGKSQQLIVITLCSHVHSSRPL